MTFVKIRREGISYLCFDYYWENSNHTQFTANIFSYYINIVIPVRLPKFSISRGKWKGPEFNFDINLTKK